MDWVSCEDSLHLNDMQVVDYIGKASRTSRNQRHVSRTEGLSFRPLALQMLLPRLGSASP